MATPELGEVKLLAVHPDIVTGQRDGAGGLWEEERDREEGKRQERENRRLHCDSWLGYRVPVSAAQHSVIPARPSVGFRLQWTVEVRRAYRRSVN